MAKTTNNGNGNKKINMMITENIVKRIETAIKNGDNIAPWQKKWNCPDMPKNLVTKKDYRGINVFLLSLQGYTSPYWLSFKQVGNLGGQVKKDEKGTVIIFWKFLKKEKDDQGNIIKDKKGDPKPKQIPMLRYYRVWNIEQTTGIDEKKIPKNEGKKLDFEPIEIYESIVKNMPNLPPIKNGGFRACYSPMNDDIHMPNQSDFHNEQSYYATLFHELGHSTGHVKRLNRKDVMNFKQFGDHSYSCEELTAELTSVFLCNKCGIDATFENSVSYLANWLTALKNDCNMLVNAGSRAQKAFDYMLNISYETKPEKETTKEKETITE